MEPLKVLVVDDEPGIRSGIERVLRGFSVSFPFSILTLLMNSFLSKPVKRQWK